MAYEKYSHTYTHHFYRRTNKTLQYTSSLQNDIVSQDYAICQKRGIHGAHNISYIGIVRASSSGWNFSSGSHQIEHNKKYCVQCLDSHTVVWLFHIWNTELQWKTPCVALVHTTRFIRRIHAKPNRITVICSINITYHTTTGTRVTHTSLHRQLQCPFK